MASPTPPRGSERRGASRTPGPWPVTLRSDGGLHVATCVDLSSTGMGLAGDLPIAVGMRVEAALAVDAGTVLRVGAEVVRRGDGSAGLHFVDVDPAGLAVLDRLLKLNARR